MTRKKKITTIKKEEPVQGVWIRVEDKWPELNESVLLFARSEEVDTQLWIGWRTLSNTWTDDTLSFELSPTHWMPLPENPKTHCPKCNHEWEPK